MSVRRLLDTHLNDLFGVVDHLLPEQQDLMASRFVTEPGLCQELVSDSYNDSPRKYLLARDQWIKSGIREWFNLQQQLWYLRDLETKIHALDQAVMEYAATLGHKEEQLYALVTEPRKPTDLQAETKRQPMRLSQLLKCAERLALMSAAPADFRETKGLAVCRPPAPQGEVFAHSRLHRTLDELLKDSDAALEERQRDLEAQNPDAPSAAAVAAAAAAAAAAANPPTEASAGPAWLWQSLTEAAYEDDDDGLDAGLGSEEEMDDENVWDG